LFKLTWREKVTPAGRLVYRLAASGRRISDNDCGSWQTPKTLDGVFSTPRTTGRPMHRATHLQTQTIALLTNADPTLASWVSPRAQDGERGGEHERGDEMGGGRDTAQRNTPGNQFDRTDTTDSQLADANGTRSAVGIPKPNDGGKGDAEVAYHGGGGESSARQRSETFWSDCDWLPCRDGKARPVEPGTFPLAHGISGRVGRLRAYGNAIVPQVAQVFIEAYLES
jgi:hypothetical protein